MPQRKYVVVSASTIGSVCYLAAVALLRRYFFGAFSVLIVGVLLGGCGSTRGVAEFQLYNESFNSQFEQGDAVLDLLGEAERKLGRSQIERRGGLTGPFRPKEAAYLVDNVDPPITASIRTSLNSLKAYNEALGGLANGEAAAALSNRINTLAGNLIGAVAASSSALGGAAAIPGAGKMIGDAGAALNVAAPIITAVATRAARESFRTQLVATYPSMRSLLETLREGTPVMFYVLYQGRVTRGSRAQGGLATAADRSALEKDRQTLAGWVLLLDKTLIAMDAAIDAAISQSTETNANGLLEASIEMKVLAEQIKKARAKP